MNGIETTALPGGYALYLVQTLLALGAVCLLAWVVLRWGIKRLYGPGRPGGVLRVVERMPLEPRRALWVVEVAGKHVLLASSEQGVSYLTDVDGEAVQAALEGAATRSRAGRSPAPE